MYGSAPAVAEESFRLNICICIKYTVNGLTQVVDFTHCFNSYIMKLDIYQISNKAILFLKECSFPLN
ncbi:CLUMA_CG011648, isoform A [Clunio marinus]|uniref:CLUMA_CG011648, isoform A n=1 Tax=Clunio marinus TaxID=568069 RepID=A0A1J1IGW9_9DIPT|nr:CLUMA_CG011648, isoform A [Clunio marinus]